MAARSLLAYNPVKIYIVLESLWTPSTLQMESTWTIAGVWTLYVESTWSPDGVLMESIRIRGGVVTYR